MPLAIRVIPCLDVDNGRVVKGINFEGLADIGDPIELASRYFVEGADELTFLDVSATIENRGAIIQVATACAEKLFVPLTVGGGIRSSDQVGQLLQAGADKVSVGSAAVHDSELVNKIANEFGSQVVVISLDIKRGNATSSGFEVTTHGGRQLTGVDAFDFVRKVIDSGAGELLINSIDADGTKSGFDLELIEAVRKISEVPIIASGGAGKPEHFVQAAYAGADAVLAASVFHSKAISIETVKFQLKEAGFEVRL
jgi:cyclase